MTRAREKSENERKRPRERVLSKKVRENERKGQPVFEGFALVTAFIALGIVWGTIVMPTFQTGSLAAWFAALNPVAQYFLYNSGLMVSVIFSAGFIFQVFRGKVHWAQTFLTGVGFWLLYAFTWDMYEAPLFLAPDGSITITSTEALAYTSVDAMLSSVYSALGASGSWLYYAVYLVTPIVMYVLAMVLLHPFWIYRAIGVVGKGSEEQ